jgi:hypothetical protein
MTSRLDFVRELVFFYSLLDERVQAVDDNYLEHTRAAAICVELALSGVQTDIEKELEFSTGVATDALRRVLAKLKERQKIINEISSSSIEDAA